MIRHHPDDALLLSLAAGRLPSGPAAVVGAHLERCLQCRGRVLDFEALGGGLLECTEPVALDADALARALARADDTRHEAARPQAAAASAGEAHMRATLPAGVSWPRSLQGCTSSSWRWIGPGRHWSRVTLPNDATANVFLLRIGAGGKLPVHSHHGAELTQVLHGAFRDGDARFDAGDFDEADGQVHHQPVAAAGDVCICLATVEGSLAFDRPIPRLWGALVGM